MKRAVFFFIPIVFFAGIAFAEIKFKPSWIIKTKSGKYIEIVSLDNGVDKNNNHVFTYVTVNGDKGVLRQGEIANSTELITAIRTAQEAQAALRQPQYAPAPNNQHGYSHSATRPRSDGGESIIVSNCRREWGTNYRMVEYCINQQQESLNRIGGKRGHILDQCRQEWGDNYRMVEYCTNQQTEAKRRLDENY